ncbi:inositol polyphosphate 5-phosphatase INPP5B/F [Microdochium nivale]|nr:inositol polyphosphate 5-phosphatase INPP5B/F [Microdochium nivale]
MALRELPTADVFVLTFNAQKQLINVPVFATHLFDAFSQHAGALPDLVVFSLQEMAPLAKAFIGSQVLGEYFGAYATALNRAAVRYRDLDRAVRAADGREDEAVVAEPFSMVATRNVGMTSSMLFARDAAAVSNVRAAEVGFGAGDMANKGAVGLRLLYTGGASSETDDDESGSTSTGSNKTEMTFVTTHLAAMEWNLSKRNKNWESLVSGLVFEDPKKHVDKAAAQSRDRGAGGEAQGLLEGDDELADGRSSRASSLEREMHNLSIYKPGSHLFVAGDLNYRIAETQPGSDDVFPSTDPDSPDYYPRFLDRDQLSLEKRAGRTLHGLNEADVKFPPTYKLVVLPKDGKEEDGEEEEEGGFAVDSVKWKWAAHRWPGWCDRILYRDLPQDRRMQVVAYDALPPIRTSDHRPVYLRIRVPLVEPETLAAIPDAVFGGDGDDGDDVPDTRVKLPFAIDVDSWQHRASVRRWETALGWTLLAAQSKEAVAAVLATIAVVLGAGWWWYTALSS